MSTDAGPKARLTYIRCPLPLKADIMRVGTDIQAVLRYSAGTYGSCLLLFGDIAWMEPIRSIAALPGYKAVEGCSFHQSPVDWAGFAGAFSAFAEACLGNPVGVLVTVEPLSTEPVGGIAHAVKVAWRRGELERPRHDEAPWRLGTPVAAWLLTLCRALVFLGHDSEALYFLQSPQCPTPLSALEPVLCSHGFVVEVRSTRVGRGTH